MGFLSTEDLLQDLGGELKNYLILLRSSTFKRRIKPTAGFSLFWIGVVEHPNWVVKGILTNSME